MNTLTVVKTQQAKVNGKKVTVETLLGTAHKQDIKYKINNRIYSGDKFFALKPQFVA